MHGREPLRAGTVEQVLDEVGVVRIVVVVVRVEGHGSADGQHGADGWQRRRVLCHRVHRCVVVEVVGGSGRLEMKTPWIQIPAGRKRTKVNLSDSH